VNLAGRALELVTPLIDAYGLPLNDVISGITLQPCLLLFERLAEQLTDLFVGQLIKIVEQLPCLFARPVRFCARWLCIGGFRSGWNGGC
jgi:hypothetical protein